MSHPTPLGVSVTRTWTDAFDPVPGMRVTESMHQDRVTPFPIRFLQPRAGVGDRADRLRAGTAFAERHATAD